MNKRGAITPPVLFVSVILILGLGAIMLRGQHLFERQTALITQKSFEDLFEKQNSDPVAVIPLGDPKEEAVAEKTSQVREQAEMPKGVSPVAPPDSPEPLPNPPAVRAENKKCSFETSEVPDRRIYISEVAWMGGQSSANDEWIELASGVLGEVDLGGFHIISKSGVIDITLESTARIRNFFLLERTDDDSVPGLSADFIYTGALSNSGEWLRLFDRECRFIDEVKGETGWHIGGDSSSRRTLERNNGDFGWHTSAVSGGTPKAKNSETAPASPVSQPTPLPPPPPTQQPPQSTSSPPAVIITEIFAGVDGNASYEFVELYNSGDASVDLTGWSLKKKSSSGNETSLLAASRLSGKTIPARSYFLAVNEGGYAGTVSADVSWATSNTIAYTNNTVVLYNASGENVNEVSWTEIPKGESYARDMITGIFAVGVSTPRSAN